VQVGEIENRPNHVRLPFEIKVSETGIDIQQAGDLAKAMSGKSKSGDTAQKIADIIALFQMGPRTGKPIYNETYADNIAREIYQKCPSGDITGLVLIREMASYPVVSGEIIKIKGHCLQPETQPKNKRKS
jgi:hypothetical protein